MKLFISQGMRGKSDEEIFETHIRMVNTIKAMYPDENIEVLDSFFQDAVEPDGIASVGVWWLGKSLELLADADIAYFADDWQDYRGCCIEHTVCKEYGIKTIGKGA